MNCDKVNDLLREFGSSIGLNSLKLNEDGYCSLLVDEKNTLHIKYNDESDTIRLFMELGYIIEDPDDKIRISMLGANILWRGTGGSVLGVDAESNAATISRQESIANMGLPQFEKMLDTFLEYADVWALKVQGVEVSENRAINQYRHTTA